MLLGIAVIDNEVLWFIYIIIKIGWYHGIAFFVPCLATREERVFYFMKKRTY
ncbi:hypothetical protein HMPREF0555_0343 [Leuconostoc mesenteroides subsp. cremoris ATCC 19254]|uniref:Uncharacterized protein n=1 Tax=Leuconostoc mesenteroides subsp. cremoris ATCC 19254 TaxID=586220 RepID=C2KI77_LEUMC|nr:hypothetical protein HMPREF0555_0343 [Leuconostoc mesenteroides subsp. cremoris ATCC 19254]